jgi:hypothetical protein
MTLLRTRFELKVASFSSLAISITDNPGGGADIQFNLSQSNIGSESTIYGY